MSELNAIALPSHIAYTRELTSDVRYNLSHSCAQAMTLEQLIALAPESSENLLKHEMGYASVQGSECLREQIVLFHQQHNVHQRQLAVDDVITFAGAQEVLAAIYKALLCEGDEVVVFTPCYPSLVSMVNAAGAIVKPIELSFNNQWQFDIEALKHAVNKNTKLIVINSPHNPTGMILNADERQQVLDIAKTFNCYLLSDDVSQAVVHDTKHVAPVDNSGELRISLEHNFLDYDKSIVVSVMSKAFGLGGVRIGWAVSPDKSLMQSLIALKALGSICTSSTDEYLAEIALKNASTIINQNIELVLKNKQLIQQLVEQHNTVLSWVPPRAGLLSLVQFNTEPRLGDYLKSLLKHSGILLLPANLFGLNDNFVRVGLGQANMGEGIKLLSQFIETHR